MSAVVVAPPPGTPLVDLRRVARDIYGTTRLGADQRNLWWAAHTPEGPGTLHVEQAAEALRFNAWGPGAGWMLEQAPKVVGLHDEPGAFRPPAGIVRDLWRRRGPLSLGRTDRVFDAAVEAVLGQKVQTTLARRSLRRMVAALGETAPGPLPLQLYPTPQRLAETPSASLHRFGIERKRGDTLRRLAVEASRLERAGVEGSEALDRRLRSIDGIGVWTSALVRAAALGDPDAVAVGDFHLAHAVCFALTGEVRGSDARMLELLEPFRPHRGRVAALLFSELGPAPRFGPRLECLPVDQFDRADVWWRDRSPFGGGYRSAPRGSDRSG